MGREWTGGAAAVVVAMAGFLAPSVATASSWSAPVPISKTFDSVGHRLVGLPNGQFALSWDEFVGPGEFDTRLWVDWLDAAGRAKRRVSQPDDNLTVDQLAQRVYAFSREDPRMASAVSGGPFRALPLRFPSSFGSETLGLSVNFVVRAGRLFAWADQSNGVARALWTGRVGSRLARVDLGPGATVLDVLAQSNGAALIVVNRFRDDPSAGTAVHQLEIVARDGHGKLGHPVVLGSRQFARIDARPFKAQIERWRYGAAVLTNAPDDLSKGLLLAVDRAGRPAGSTTLPRLDQNLVGTPQLVSGPSGDVVLVDSDPVAARRLQRSGRLTRVQVLSPAIGGQQDPKVAVDEQGNAIVLAGRGRVTYAARARAGKPFGRFARLPGEPGQPDVAASRGVGLVAYDDSAKIGGRPSLWTRMITLKR